MKLINNKVACSFFIVNLIFIFIGYCGWLTTAGYVNGSLGASQYVQGTPEEYWKINLDYYYSIIYIALLALSYLVILLHKGSSVLSTSISRSLKYQILILVVIDIITRFININHPNEIESLSYWYLVVPFIAAFLGNRSKPLNRKLIIISIVSCLTVLLMLSFQKNILKSDMANRIVQSGLQYTPVGKQLFKYEPTILGVKQIDDDVTTMERITKNYTDIVAVISYPLINKMNTNEIFEMVDNMSKNYIVKNETYLKEKLGDNYTSTRLHSYNKIGKLNDVDMKLLDIYQMKGIDAAMNELKTTKNSFIKLAIENKKNFDERPKM